MQMYVHPARNMLRGDERYNPRFTREPEVRSDGASILTGEMRPDSPIGVAVRPRLGDIPFRLIVPRDADYLAINAEIWHRLQNGKPLWDLDFTSPQQTRSDSGLGLGLGLFGAVLLLAASLN
jgi:hypothetical protein